MLTLPKCKHTGKHTYGQNKAIIDAMKSAPTCGVFDHRSLKPAHKYSKLRHVAGECETTQHEAFWQLVHKVSAKSVLHKTQKPEQIQIKSKAFQRLKNNYTAAGPEKQFERF